MKRGDQGVFTLEVSNWMPGPNPERRRLSFGLELSRVHAQTGGPVRSLSTSLSQPWGPQGAARGCGEHWKTLLRACQGPRWRWTRRDSVP